MTKYEGVPESCRAAYDEAFRRLEAAFVRGNKLMICGNGGSAADAEHIVGELMKGFLLKRPVAERIFPDGVPDRRWGSCKVRCRRCRSTDTQPGGGPGERHRRSAVYAQQVLGVGAAG